MTIIRPDISLIYSLLTAKCIDLSLLIDSSSYFKNVIQYQSGVRLTEVFNKRNKPSTIYFSVRVRLRGIRYKGKYKTLISGPCLVSA